MFTCNMCSIDCNCVSNNPYKNNIDMKANANEMPEKIYLNPLLMEDGESIVRRCTFERQRDNDIEYTRTDAIIEKACVWIKENLLKHTYVYEGEVGIGMAAFLEEFKQAMKGE